MDTFDDMIKCGILPNVYTINRFFPYCKRPEKGRELLNMMNKYQL